MNPLLLLLSFTLYASASLPLAEEIASAIEGIYVARDFTATVGDYIDCRLDLDTGQTVCHYKVKSDDNGYKEDDDDDDRWFDDFYFDTDDRNHGSINNGAFLGDTNWATPLVAHCTDDMIYAPIVREPVCTLISADKRSFMLIQPDGNLCVYRNSGGNGKRANWIVTWCALDQFQQKQLSQHTAFVLTLDLAGQFSLNISGNASYWSSSGRSHSTTGFSYLKLHSEGNLCVHVNSSCPWCSGNCSHSYCKNDKDIGRYRCDDSRRSQRNQSFLPFQSAGHNNKQDWRAKGMLMYSFLCFNQTMYPGSALVSESGDVALVLLQ